jgi:hypothetical protein
MNKIEALVLAISNINGGFDPGSKAFINCNPLLLRTYRPERKCDSEHIRIFTSILGGLKAGASDIAAKTNAANNKLSGENVLSELLALYGLHKDTAVKPVVSYLKRALNDDSISARTPLSYFLTETKEQE